MPILQNENEKYKNLEISSLNNNEREGSVIYNIPVHNIFNVNQEIILESQEIHSNDNIFKKLFSWFILITRIIMIISMGCMCIFIIFLLFVFVMLAMAKAFNFI
jgi:hypothetical protein